MESRNAIAVVSAFAPTGAPAPRTDAPGGGGDAPPSNTASHSYDERGFFRVLRIGVDSLYVSYPGDISPAVEVELLERKELAQRRSAGDQARAQWSVGDHIFEVKDKGQRSFPYILEDNAFRVCLSSGEGRQMRSPTARFPRARWTRGCSHGADRGGRGVGGGFPLPEREPGRPVRGLSN
jgi:hypothetical protein